MSGRIIFSAMVGTVFGGVTVLAQGQGQVPQNPMIFFIVSAAPGTGTLGGLSGADRICQTLAQAAGAGNHTWHAYLGTQAEKKTDDVLKEKSEAVTSLRVIPNEKDTGSDSEGRGLPTGIDSMCNSWAPDSAGYKAIATLHRSDRSSAANRLWNSGRDCSKLALISTGATGRFYCLADH